MKKSIYNILFGVFGQIVTIAIGLCLPRLRIVSFGSEVNGMLSSVQQVFTYLALLEAGIGGASLQALYGPVAEKNRGKINSVLATTNRHYKRVGSLYIVSFVAMAIIYPIAVESKIPPLTVVSVILLNGTGHALAFFFQGKYKILLQAEGKQYIITNMTTFVNFGSNVIKVILILSGFDIIALQLAYFAFNIIQVIYFAWYIRKHYKWLDLNVEGDSEAISQKNSVLVHQISQMVFNHTDVLLLTVFCDLKVVSVYAVYTMIYDMVSVLIGHITSGFSYKLGQLFNSAYDKFLKLYDIIEPYYIAISFALYCVAHIFILDFMKLYTKGIDDVNYTLKYLPVLFTTFKLLVSGRATSGFVQTYAGHFKKTQGRAIIEAAINRSVSIVFVNVCGIYRVLIGTIAALLYRATDMIIYTNKRILNRSPWNTYKYWMANLVLFVLMVIVFEKVIPQNIDSYLSLIITIFISTCFIVPIFFGATFLMTYKSSKTAFKTVLQYYKKRFKFKNSMS